jgi:transcriptional regulator with XRE-family HTH domain
MTQEALAAAVGVSRSAIAQWETGRAGQLTGNLAAVCRVLDLDAAELVGGRHDPKAAAPAADLSSPREAAATGDEVALLRLYRVCSPGDQQLLLMTLRRLSHNRE